MMMVVAAAAATELYDTTCFALIVNRRCTVLCLLCDIINQYESFLLNIPLNLVENIFISTKAWRANINANDRDRNKNNK